MRDIVNRASREEGFTLIEILVVILVLAALAALAIPTFTDQRAKAHGAAGKTEARMAHTALESHQAAEETYDASTADLVAIEPALASTRDLTVSGTRDTFRLEVRALSGVTFTVERDADGALRRICAPRGTGGCPAGGSW